jgi:prepilin peptidase CpaA
VKAEQFMTCLGVSLTIAAAASVFDIRRRRIPNRLMALACLAGWLASGTMQSWDGLSESVLGTITGAACWLPFWQLRWIGGGDVKLLAALGAWLGPAHTWPVFLITAQLLGLIDLLRRIISPRRQRGNALPFLCQRIPVAPLTLGALMIWSGVQGWFF